MEQRICTYPLAPTGGVKLAHRQPIAYTTAEHYSIPKRPSLRTSTPPASSKWAVDQQLEGHLTIGFAVAWAILWHLTTCRRAQSAYRTPGPQYKHKSSPASPPRKPALSRSASGCIEIRPSTPIPRVCDIARVRRELSALNPSPGAPIGFLESRFPGLRQAVVKTTQIALISVPDLCSTICRP